MNSVIRAARQAGKTAPQMRSLEIAQANLETFSKQCEEATDPATKAFLLSRIGYWAVEVDIETVLKNWSNADMGSPMAR